MRVLVVGGRGFVGGHLMARFAMMGIEAESFDLLDDQDAHDLLGLTIAMRGCDTVIHLASNADIALAQSHPLIDFDNGTTITAMVVEACRLSGVQTIVYASGSGIYGDHGSSPLSESYGPLLPTSPYGASKIAGEALISAYCHMFNMTGIALRPANIVGPHQTHGVGYDFINKLKADPERLEILGDGSQSKHYVHIDDVIDAIVTTVAYCYMPFTAYNVATLDSLTVYDIADMACDVLDVRPKYEFLGGTRGWAGDIPVVRLHSSKLRNLGWSNNLTSREAMWDALKAMA